MPQQLYKPIIEKFDDNYTISIYYHPVIPGYFTYSLTIFQTQLVNPSPIDDQYSHLFGCFRTAQQAIVAALGSIAPALSDK
jgi:hypothetical protein